MTTVNMLRASAAETGETFGPSAVKALWESDEEKGNVTRLHSNIYGKHHVLLKEGYLV